MFKKFRYRLKLNAALRELEIQPSTLNPAFRDEVVAMGLREHLAPREAAMEVLSVVYPGLNLVDRLATLAVIRQWRRSARVRESRFQRALSGNLSDLQSTAFRDK
ncbi:hypothetical protein [Hydrogenophaga sp.]|jgi:hypothetical protein|uniref:hypothetical protein n=1 Tax=Hydrogenophaga sp. TaxID=1904254 RepID=UPI002731380F|nr:hypothetical protein [Hydrogenophaga sp.]MDP1683804.1 hypothetical protein [Hydrogenophaga sp.]